VGAALLVTRVTLVDGWWTPVRVVGPSMAPLLHGQQGAFSCRNCALPIVFDTERPPPSRIVCPQCGAGHEGNTPFESTPGQRVLVDRWPLWRRWPARLEVVALTRSTSDPTLIAKRVVGLPGETVAIRRGELWIDGELWRKTVAQQRQLAILVHDDAYLPTGALEGGRARWEPDDPSQWTRAADGHHFESPADLPPRAGDADDHFAWLCFHPFVWPGVPVSTAPRPLDDADWYNPALSRPLNDVFDVRVMGKLALDDAGAFAWQIDDGWQLWRVEWHGPTHRLSLWRNDRPVARQPAPSGGSEVHFEFAVCDQQVFFLLNDRICFAQSYDAPQGKRRQLRSAAALQLGARGGLARVSALRVARDIYWLDPQGLAHPWALEQPLGADMFFVLGDNVPASIDSRHFGPVSRARLRGVVHHWPMQ
jgi:signal peptidase I